MLLQRYGEAEIVLFDITVSSQFTYNVYVQYKVSKYGKGMELSVVSFLSNSLEVIEFTYKWKRSSLWDKLSSFIERTN